MSLFRKLLKSNPKEDGAINQFARPNSVQTMGASLQKKFARGVQYNMKIVIRGDRNVGKTCLFERLQGQGFKEEYIPTDEIQVASIHWNYKTTDDVVKVEVWDIVDKGRKRKKCEGLKLENDIPSTEEPILDADFLDVYKGTHGVLMMLDMTKSWTLDYVERELPCVPNHIPVLVLANHRDMGHHRTVSADQVKTFIENLERPQNSAQVRYTETSMRSAFGLKYVHRFFSLPFLQLQRETLLKQLETNSRDIAAVIEELECMEDSDETNYELFRTQLLTNRTKSPATSPTTPTAELPSPTSPPPGPVAQDKSPRLHAPPARPIPGMEAYLRGIGPAQNSKSGGAAAAAKPGAAPEEAPARQHPSPTAVQPGLYKDRGMSKSSPAIVPEPSHFSPSARPNVDDFVPPEESTGLSSFLEDAADTVPDSGKPDHRLEDSSSDEDAGNPMVAGFQEDLDSDDEKSGALPARAPVVASRHLEMSTDEGEDEDEDFDASAARTASGSRKSSSREASDSAAALSAPTTAASSSSGSVSAQHREMSSSGYTSASSEKPAATRPSTLTNGTAEAARLTTTAPSVAALPSYVPPARGDLDSSDEEEAPAKASKPVKNSRSLARRKSSQPSTMEEEENEGEEEEAEEVEEKVRDEKPLPPPPPPAIVLDTSDFDFLERRGSVSKASSSLVTPSGIDSVEDSAISKKQSKKHRREKDGETHIDDQEKKKTKKPKKKTTGDVDEEGRKPRKKASHRTQVEDENNVSSSGAKKGKKKSKRKGAAPAEPAALDIDGNSDLERFLNDSNPAAGAYEVL